jgi:hypothetical protein
LNGHEWTSLQADDEKKDTRNGDTLQQLDSKTNIVSIQMVYTVYRWSEGMVSAVQ